MTDSPRNAEVVCSRDKNADYVLLHVTPMQGQQMTFRVSLGGAQALAEEINSALGE